MPASRWIRIIRVEVIVVVVIIIVIIIAGMVGEGGDRRVVDGGRGSAGASYNKEIR